MIQELLSQLDAVSMFMLLGIAVMLHGYIQTGKYNKQLHKRNEERKLRRTAKGSGF